MKPTKKNAEPLIAPQPLSADEVAATVGGFDEQMMMEQPMGEDSGFADASACW